MENVAKLESKVKRFAPWPLRGETILPSVIDQMTKIRKRYPLFL
jgi:hypothetical protein